MSNYRKEGPNLIKWKGSSRSYISSVPTLSRNVQSHQLKFQPHHSMKVLTPLIPPASNVIKASSKKFQQVRFQPIPPLSINSVLPPPKGNYKSFC